MINVDKKILFIEDDPDQLMIFQTKFDMERMFLITATESKRAMELAKREKPKLILLDLILRNENGFDILVELKKNEQTKDIPVIVFTNYVSKESRERANELGAIDYIVKTQVTPSEVVERVRKIIGE
jgi:two-component system cell cycle response regulator